MPRREPAGGQFQGWNFHVERHFSRRRWPSPPAPRRRMSRSRRPRRRSARPTGPCCGCRTAARARHTLKVRVQMPEGVIAVKPMPKAGWTLETVKRRHTRSPTTTMARDAEGVTEVIWTGELPDAFYDEFVFRGMLTERAGGRDGALLPGRPGVRRRRRALDRDPGRGPGPRQPRVPGARRDAAAGRRRALTTVRRVRALALLCLVAALLAGAAPLRMPNSSPPTPAAASMLAEAPDAATLTFSEPVRPLAARWFPSGGGDRRSTPCRSAEGERLVVPVPRGHWRSGTVLLSWRVVSADGHPVGGSHIFSIGAPTAPAELPFAGPGAGRGDRARRADASHWSSRSAARSSAASSTAEPTPPRGPRGSRWLWAAAGGAAGGGRGVGAARPRPPRPAGRVPARIWHRGRRRSSSPFAATAIATVLAGLVALAALRQTTQARRLAPSSLGFVAAISFALFGHAATAPPRWMTVPAVMVHAGGLRLLDRRPAWARRAGRLSAGDLGRAPSAASRRIALTAGRPAGGERHRCSRSCRSRHPVRALRHRLRAAC